jgi:hypothetical protein
MKRKIFKSIEDGELLPNLIGLWRGKKYEVEASGFMKRDTKNRKNISLS